VFDVPFPIFVRDLPQREVFYPLLAGICARGRLNINLWLYTVWFALNGYGRLRRSEFKRLESALHPWHDRVCLALRRLSAALVSMPVCRQWVDHEVDFADQLERQLLAQTLSAMKRHRRRLDQQLLDSSHNLAAYYKIARICVDAPVRTATLKILAVLFPDANDRQITAAFDQALNAAQLEDAELLQLFLV
jgi:hypothetical protein